MKFNPREARMQDLTNRQNSIEINDQSLIDFFHSKQQHVYRLSVEAYQDCIDAGIAKEQARVLLPEGLTPSVVYMSGSIRSWIHYIQTRSGIDTQKEHRIIAQECQRILIDKMPFLSEIFTF